MIKRFKNYFSAIKNNRPLSREEMIEITEEQLEQTTIKVAELRAGLLKSYHDDNEADINYYKGMLGSYQLYLNEYQSNMKALHNPDVQGRFSYERIRTRYIKENRHKIPFDLVVERAKRDHEQRLQQVEEWIDNNFCPLQSIERLKKGEYYKDCPIGNFAEAEKKYHEQREYNLQNSTVTYDQTESQRTNFDWDYSSLDDYEEYDG